MASVDLASAARPGRVFVMGDVHGHLDELTHILGSAGLLNTAGTWSGGNSRLWFLGDLFDRGPDGTGVLRLVRRLEHGASVYGGEIHCLFGNHELMLIAAHRFSGQPRTGPYFLDAWLRNGGEPAELAALTDDDIRWLGTRPALGVIPIPNNKDSNVLVMHADTFAYLKFGSDLAAINRSCARAVASSDPTIWSRLLIEFADRHAFDGTDKGGVERARRMLHLMGANRLVHGHTPISKMTGQADHEIDEPFVYANGLCVNVDPGLYRGGRGFIYELD